MRRSLLLVVTALLMVIAIALPADGLPGPDPTDSPDHFQIVVYGTGDDGEREIFDAPMFLRADGWDFGDREAYRCAYAEYIVNGEVLFKVEFERLLVPGHDGNYVVINDRGGMETGDGDTPASPVDLCGMPAGAGPRSWDGSPFVPGGVSLPVFRDGQPLVTMTFPETVSTNVETHYTGGDDPGEAYMWYVEAGEANDAVLRIQIVPMAPGVSLQDQPPTPPPGSDHESRISLRLEGRLKAVGHVRVPDGAAECKDDRVVVIERRSRARWADVGRDLTRASGSYSQRLRAEDGVYRARVLRSTLPSGEICLAATSQRMDYRGA
jgi:hypothetical protein